MSMLHKIICVLMLSFGTINTPLAQSLPKLGPVDLSTLKPSDFRDDELDLPYFLKHFHRVANNVVESGTDRGFINISVWRGQGNHHTYNARIMEGIHSLVYFYTTKRPWNVYYASPVLKLRIEAAMEFWCRIQNADGRFSEYGPKQWNLAATAFATKFMGESLVLLKNGPPIDHKILSKVVAANRKAILVTLTSDSLYMHAKNYTNQFTNVFAGALAHFSVYPDPEIRKHLVLRIQQSGKDLQSSAGFFYERGGTDFGYNFNTHHSNLWMAYHYARGTELEKYFVEDEKRFYDWISYNAVPEPSGYFTTNRAIEMRQRAPVVSSFFTLTPLGEKVPGVNAFLFSKEEKQMQIRQARKDLENNWPSVPDLKPGEFSTFSPYAFLHRRHYQWNPSGSEKKSSYAQLPYIKRKQFVHQKMDNRNPTVFTFIKKPGYYVAFNSGPKLNEQQRLGLGLIWHPKAGTILQSQTGSDSAAWGTRNAEGKLYENDSLDVTFKHNTNNYIPKPGSHDLTGDFSISYSLGKGGDYKELFFEERSIYVNVAHKKNCSEQLPFLLTKNDSLYSFSSESIMLEKNKAKFIITVAEGVKAEIRQTNLVSGDHRVVVLMLQSKGPFIYTITELLK